MSAETERWEALRQQLALRSGGRCEWSGVPIGAGRWSLHHRMPRSAGGTRHVEDLADLVLLSGDGVVGSHGWVEAHRAEAEARGYIVRHGAASPADVPIVLHSGREVLLDPDSPFYIPTGRYALGLDHAFQVGT